VLVQEEHVDPVAQGAVEEWCGHADLADAHYLANALEVQPEQDFAVVLDGDPVTAAAD
jgi:hypothetical protein